MLVTSPSLLHHIHPTHRLYRPNEYGVGHPFRSGHDVEQLMNAVDQIDIAPSRWPKHNFRPLGPPVVFGVTGLVVWRKIGFGFGDAGTGFLPVNAGDNFYAKEGLGDGDRVGAPEEMERGGLQSSWVWSLAARRTNNQKK